MLTARRTTGLVFFPAFDWAIDPRHPEREERLLYTQDQVFEEGLFDIPGIREFKPDLASIEDVRRVHFCAPDETAVTTESHFISAGGTLAVARRVMSREVERGFALVRPPGHHAMRLVHGSRGFCNINMEAIMVEYLRSVHGIKKIAIVDTDCHHGDGTQDIYWHDPDVLFISLHQDGRTLYPGSGFVNEQGGPNAHGLTVNIPLPPKTGEDGFLYTIEHMVMPILADFGAELVINSAGQDNHFADPITNMNFSAQGYARLTDMLNADIAVLEGGYSIEGALPYMNLGIVLAMAGMDYSRVREPNYTPESVRQEDAVTNYIRRLRDKILMLWERREEDGAAARKGKTVEERTRSIYYDTDNIIEKQRERLRICGDCGGAVQIDSASDVRRAPRIRCVHIPVSACEACQKQGREWFDAAGELDADLVLLQNRPEDRWEERLLNKSFGPRPAPGK
ncbi:MAG: histone deacetylase [Desulfobacterales bacterium]|nr:MAG: histone deacetylase [Desulfobacterales bacterium]